VADRETADAQQTKDRILRAAARLFGARGLSASVRAITSEAGVNVAAVHYHFGGRESLAREVFARSVAPVNELRLARLARLEAGPEPATPEALLRALLEPVFDAAGRERGIVELGALLLAEPAEAHAALVEELFGEVMRRFRAAFGRVLPALSEAELHDRLVFAIGALVHVLSRRGPLRPDGSRVGADLATRERLVAFLAAAFAAPATGAARAKRSAPAARQETP
jgi:AcrR family transcriptional regulator